MEINPTCPVCYFYIVEPHCCENGHDLCHKCDRRVQNCPLCRSTSARKLNARRYLELCEDRNIPCLNVEEGCTVTGGMRKMLNHVNVCPKTLTTCVVSGCQWAGSPSAKTDHIYNKHRDIFEEDFICVVSGCQWVGSPSAKTDHIYDKHRDMFVEDFRGPHDPGSEFIIILQGKYMMFVTGLHTEYVADYKRVYYKFRCLNDENFSNDWDIILNFHNTHRCRSDGYRVLCVECTCAIIEDPRLLQDCKIEIVPREWYDRGKDINICPKLCTP